VRSTSRLWSVRGVDRSLMATMIVARASAILRPSSQISPAGLDVL
jgi:hypothetical protein